MKLTVVEEHVAHLTSLDEALKEGKPEYYHPPYYLLQKGRNAISQFEFLTRQEILNKSGKRKWFDHQISLAQEFETFNEALTLAKRFKSYDSQGLDKFYIVGYAEALVVEMHIKYRMKNFDKLIEKGNSQGS